METVIAGDDRLECRWWGKSDCREPVLVLLHDGLGCVATWKDFPELLHHRTGLGAFAYSRAGYGGSDPASLPRDIDYMHVEGRPVLGTLLEAAGIDDAILVGHSDGASIAIVHAAAPAVHIRALVLLAPHVFCEGRSIESIRAAGDAFRSGDLRARLSRYHGDRVEHAFHGWHDAWLQPGFRQWSITEFLPNISVPVLLIQGDRDEYGTAAQLDAIEHGVSGPVTRQWIMGCGHAPHRERPDEALAAIASFLAGIGIVR